MPSADVFKTRKGDPVVEIPGVGLVDDRHGVPLDRAALVMSELQDKRGKPLTGQVLVGAAKKWAERVNLQVSTGTAPARPAGRRRPKRSARPKAPVSVEVGKGPEPDEDDPAAVAAEATAALSEPYPAPAPSASEPDTEE